MIGYVALLIAKPLATAVTLPELMDFILPAIAVLAATLAACGGIMTYIAIRNHDAMDKEPDTRFAFGLLRLFMRGKERRKLEGDLLEECTEEILPEFGHFYARVWLIAHVILAGLVQLSMFVKNSPLSSWFKKTGGASPRDDSDDKANGDNADE